MNNEYVFQDFVNEVADYIDAEYDNADIVDLNDDERITIRNILDAHYHFNDSVSNTATYVIRYLRESRSWLKDNIQ